MPLSGQARLGVGPRGIGELIAVAVQLEDHTKGIFNIDHAIGFLVWKILADRHPLLATCGNDFLQKFLKVRVLNCEMECPVAAVGKIVVRCLVAFEFEQLDADTVCGR